MKWTKHSAGKPFGEDHLLFCEDDRGEFMVVGYWNRLTKSWMVNGEIITCLPVTHYMPLPQRPAWEKEGE